ncbi:MAG: hypothetical protein IJH47_09800, partial [Oscillospiraceae bacterium]|nr:hypothetical protein [Oscillospiraceae bacterium]
VDNLSGTITGDADIVNHGDLTVDDLSVDGDLDLTVEGDLTGGDAAPGTANITAETANITADGNVGSSGDPLETAVDNLTVDGDDINIHSIHDVTIDKITGDDIDIGAEGEIYAGEGPVHIEGESLDIDAFGSIGTEEKPLVVRISGPVNSHTQYGWIYLRNIYKAPVQQTGWAQMVFRGDWSPAEVRIMELFRDEETVEGFALISRFGDVRIALIGAPDGLCQGGRILGILAMTDEGNGLTSEFRYLLLRETQRSMMRSMGFRWVVFQVGDRVLVIDRDALETKGDYLFALDPTRESGLLDDGAIAAMWYEGEYLLSWNDGNEMSGPGAGALQLAVTLLTAETA